MHFLHSLVSSVFSCCLCYKEKDLQLTSAVGMVEGSLLQMPSYEIYNWFIFRFVQTISVVTCGKVCNVWHSLHSEQRLLSHFINLASFLTPVARFHVLVSCVNLKHHSGRSKFTMVRGQLTVVCISSFQSSLEIVNFTELMM